METATKENKEQQELATPETQELLQSLEELRKEEADFRQAQAEMHGEPPPDQEAPKTEEANPEKKAGEPEPALEPKKEPVPEEPTADPEDDPNFKPTDADWAKNRRARKDAEHRLAELEKRLAEKETAFPDLSTPAPVTAKPEAKLRLTPESHKKHTTGELINGLLQIESGEREVSERAYLEEHLVNKAPQEIQAIIDQARQGKFGDTGIVISDICRKYLPEVEANFRTREQAKVVRMQSFNKATKFLPDLIKPESADRKDFLTAFNEIAAKNPDFQDVPDAPEIVAEAVKMKRELDGSKTLREENARLKAELDAANKRLGIIQAPIVKKASRPPQAKESDIDQELIAAQKAAFSTA